MKCIYINESGTIEREHPSLAVINAIVVDSNKRTEIKNTITQIVLDTYGPENRSETLRSTKVSPNNIIPYANVISVFNKTDAISFDAMVIKKFTNKKRYPTYVALIHSIFNRLEGEDIRVFIPTKKYAKTVIKKLREELIAVGIDCEIYQNPIEESRFYQMADIGGGMLSYYLRDDQFFDKIDQPGKSQLVHYVLGMKKTKNKINITYIS